MQFLLLVNRIWTNVKVCYTHLVAVEADSTNNQTCPIHSFQRKSYTTGYVYY